ncbi:MAG TPA: hypothetical protein VF972_11500 [Actinomycetota bacterium]
MIKRLFLAAAAVIFVTGVVVALLLPNDFACQPAEASTLTSSCDATLPLRIGIAGAGLAAGLVIAAAGAWLDRFGRFGR